MMDITRFCIYGLFGSQDVEIDIKDNRLVVVGVNGIGKSTVINIFYHLIARRWKPLTDFDFDKLSITINEKVHTLGKQEIIDFLGPRGGLPRLIRNRLAHRTPNVTEAEIFRILTNSELRSSEVQRLSTLLAVSPAELIRVRNRYRELGAEDRLLFPDSSNFLQVATSLKTAIVGRILYLPTYRRIEKDLKAIVPDIEQRVRSYEERYARTAEPGEAEPTPYVDLVEFGMQDVKGLIDQTLAELNRFSRGRLNELTGAYLGEVIRGDVEKFDVASVSNFSQDDIIAILNRVEEHTLSQTDKDILLRSLTHIHQDPKKVSTRERYSAHFFAKLAGVARAVEELESPILGLVDVCNKNYLYGKRIIYDRSTFSLNIYLNNGKRVQLEHLSSGEKQIVSLFCHIYLSRTPHFVIIIDEPELSLSVDWQSNLLPDIVGTGKCSFLAAVTHSPFIYDNAFDPYAIDLRDCIVAA